MAESPRPWRMEYDEVLGVNSIVDADGRTVCEDIQYYPTAPSVDDMRIIVAAVNLRERMPKVLTLEGTKARKEIIERIDSGTLDWTDIEKVLIRIGEEREYVTPAPASPLGE